jgi:peptidoglycan/xylan/chitin deacetylase (PgdA/CDA1 family)
MSSGQVPGSSVEVEARLDALDDLLLVRPNKGTVGRLSEQALNAQYGPVSTLAWTGDDAYHTNALAITTFQSGHGWSFNGAGSTGADDTTDYVIGSQSYKIITATGGAAVNLRKTGMASQDWTARVPRVWVKVDDIEDLSDVSSSILLYLGDGTFTNFFILDANIPVSGSPTATPLRSGEWIALTFPWRAVGTTGSPNRAAITDIQLVVKPKSGVAVTIRFNSVEMVDDATDTFPNGVISLSFDDGSASQLTRAAPKMAQYGYRGTLMPVVEWLGDANRLTLADVRTLHDVYQWDVAAHAYSAAAHSGNGFTDMTEDELDAELRAQKGWLLENGFRGRDHIAYPFSNWDSTVARVARRYFQTARVNYVNVGNTWPCSCRADRLESRNCGSTDLIASLQSRVDVIKSSAQWGVFTFHDIVASGASGATQMNKTTFDSLIDYIYAQGVPVLTINDVARATNKSA